MERILIILLCLSLTINSVLYTDNNRVLKDQPDTLRLPHTGEMYKKTPLQLEEEQNKEIADSINLAKTLEKALKIVNNKRDNDKFEIQTDTLSIYYGHLFSTAEKHVIIKRTFAYGVYIDIYKLKNDSFKPVCSKKADALTFIGDTIQDINGDGLKDYLFHWYPESGCCMRNVYDVFLQKKDGDFTDETEFINPVFSAKEKTIRGICYGWSAPYYQYKWNGYIVDTVEYIYRSDSIKNKQFIKRKHFNEKEKGEILNQLPDEYMNLYHDTNY
jgi:hypothetical protein